MAFVFGEDASPRRAWFDWLQIGVGNYLGSLIVNLGSCIALMVLHNLMTQEQGDAQRVGLCRESQTLGIMLGSMSVSRETGKSLVSVFKEEKFRK